MRDPKLQELVLGGVGAKRPVRVCPDCGYRERAARVLRTRRRMLARARTGIGIELRWSSTHCPADGVLLVERCHDRGCSAFILDAGSRYCHDCGVPYWWRPRTSDDPPIRLAHEDGNVIEKDIGGRVNVHAIQGSLAQIEVGAVVSSDDVSGAMRSGSAAMLKAVGGDEVEVPAVGAPHELGDAWVTPRGKLPAKHVIHVAIIDTRNKTNEEAIARAMERSLGKAEDLGIDSIAYPVLGTGRTRFPAEDSTRLMREAIHRHVRDHPHSTLTDIAFVHARPEQRDEFVTTYRSLIVADPRSRARFTFLRRKSN